MSFSKQRIGAGAVEAGLDGDAGVGEAALVEVEDGFDEVLRGDMGGADGLAVEAKGLSGDLADAGEFALRHFDVFGDVLVEGRWSWR